MYASGPFNSMDLLFVSIASSSANEGGGIYTEGAANITSTTFVNNSGGAITLHSANSFWLNNLKFSGNTGTPAADIVISQSAQVDLENSVFNGCSDGGGILSSSNLIFIDTSNGYTSTLTQANNTCNPNI